MALAFSPLLEVRRLTVAHTSSSRMVPIVRDISLEILEGETLALAGETGSGKSTLALSILGLLDSQMQVRAETIFYEGRSLQSTERRSLQGIAGGKIGVVFQDSRGALNPVLTIADHLIETIQAHQPVRRREARAKAMELLHEVGLSRGHATLYPFELSGGMSQRVGIALALCNHPKLLIADEPTSALDATIQAQILDLLLLMKQRHGLALLLISHDLALISRAADRVAVVYHGRIVESGTRDDVLSAPAHPYARCLIQCQPGLQHHHETHRLNAIPGSVPVAGQDFPGCAFAPRCTHAERRCQESVPDALRVSATHWALCIRDFSKSATND
jgi:oligopeptide/dipeptide ABC transporter ATP-binding protein